MRWSAGRRHRHAGRRRAARPRRRLHLLHGQLRRAARRRRRRHLPDAGVGQERGEHVVRAAAVPEGGRTGRAGEARGGVPRRRHELLHVRDRSGLRQRRPGHPHAGAVQGGAPRPDDGDRQLRHVEQPVHDVRDHGVREAGPVGVAAALAGFDLAGVGTGAPPRGGGDRPHPRLRAGDARDPARRRGLHHRVGADREGDHLGDALRDHRCGRRRGAHRGGARHAVAGRRRPRLAAGAVLPDPHRGRPPSEARARAQLRPRRPQLRRLPGHRHARRQRHPERRPRGAWRPHDARPARLQREDLTSAVENARHASGIDHRRRDVTSGRGGRSRGW